MLRESLQKVIFFSLVGASLYGNVNFPIDESVSEGFVIEEEKTPYPPPFNFSALYVDVSKTSFRTPDVKGEDLFYRELDLNATYTYAPSEIYGFSLGGGYIGSRVEWEENPDFQETHFHYITTSLSAYTAAVSDWIWKCGVNFLFDTEVWSLADYTLYQGYLFGKYTLAEPLLFNVGFLLEVGLHKEKIWPVLGFDYFPSKKVDIHLVYPLDISINYHPISALSLGASMRFLRNRHRVKDSEPLPMAIFEYHTQGVEADVNYMAFAFINLKAFVGSTFNGDLKVTNRNNHNAIHYKFRGSLYGGAAATLIF